MLERVEQSDVEQLEDVKRFLKSTEPERRQAAIEIIRIADGIRCRGLAIQMLKDRTDHAQIIDVLRREMLRHAEERGYFLTR